jgi:hypothetical protein
LEYRIEFLVDPPAVAVVTLGRAEVEGWTRFHGELRNDARARGLPLLVDHSDLDASSLSGDDVRKIGQSVLSFHRSMHAPRRAVVVASSFAFGLTRMAHAQLGSAGDQTVKVFRSVEEARAWLTD